MYPKFQIFSSIIQKFLIFENGNFWKIHESIFRKINEYISREEEIITFGWKCRSQTFLNLTKSLKTFEVFFRLSLKYLKVRIFSYCSVHRSSAPFPLGIISLWWDRRLNYYERTDPKVSLHYFDSVCDVQYRYIRRGVEESFLIILSKIGSTVANSSVASVDLLSQLLAVRERNTGLSPFHNERGILSKSRVP